MSTNFSRRISYVITSMLLLLGVAACGPSANIRGADQAVRSKLTEAQATAIAENALQALNAGDYAAYSRDWSAAMKAGIKESDFRSWRQQVLSTDGKYQRIEQVKLLPGKTSGYVRWQFVCRFEKAQVSYTLGFTQAGEQVEGVFLEPVS